MAKAQHEIEDVLASIRRLVSEEMARGDAPDMDRLVLGAEHRVIAVEERDAPDASDEAAMPPAPTLPDALRPAVAAEAGLDDPLEEALDATDAHDDAPEAVALAPAPEAALPALSEEMLREVVADVVRAELAGALGERITRNVRKLVRREIRQMMSGEEFD